MKLSIIIPAYNEENRLGPMLQAYAEYFGHHYGNDVEILVVANGCRDRTADVAREWAARYPQIRVLEEPRPIGKGGAIMMGMRAANGEWVGYVDADLSTPPEAFDDLVQHIGDAGIIIASRWIRGAQVRPKQSVRRRIASRIFNAVVRVLFGLKVHDTQCGAKVLTRKALDTVLPRLGITRWAFDVDLLFQVQRAGFAIKEHPTVWSDQPGSQLRLFHASIEMLLAITRLRLIYSPFKWVVTLYDRTLGRWIRVPPQGLGADRGSLWAHGTVLVVATLFGSLCNVLYHVVVGRALVPAEYGTLASMLGIILIAGTPMDALRTAVAHFAACYAKEGRLGAVKTLMVEQFQRMLVPAFLIVAGGILSARGVSEFFQIPSTRPVVLTSWVLAGSLFMPILLGALLGLQAFVSMSIAQHSWGLVRVTSAMLFVWMGKKTASWGIMAQALGVIATLVLGLLAVKRCVPVRREKMPLRDRVGSYFMQSLIALAGFAILMNADILLAKRFFSPDEAGLFARAGTIARTMVFVTTPIALAMFPKVASKAAPNTTDVRYLVHAILYSALLIGLAVGVIVGFPQLPLWIMYGDRGSDPLVVGWVRAMSVAMAPLGLTFVLLNFEMAQHRFQAAWALVACGLVYIVCVTVWHHHLWQIPLFLGLVGLIATGVILISVVRAAKSTTGVTTTEAQEVVWPSGA